jgi:hypothetical protein
MAAYLKSNVFSDVYINGNCIVKGTITTLGSGTQWTTTGSAIYYNTGNVGIGLINPTSILNVNVTGSTANLYSTTSGSSASLFIVNTADSRRVFVGMDGTGLFAFSTGALALGTDNTPIIFAPNYSGGEKMRILTTGYVGIGTTNPGSLLTVSGGVAVGSGYQTTLAPTNGLIVQGGVGIGTTNPGVNALQVTGNVVTQGFTSNSTNTVFNYDTLTVPFLSATQIGIGNTAPTALLDIRGGSISLGSYDSTSGSRYVGYYNVNDANGPLVGMEIENTTLTGNYSQKLHFRTHWFGTNNGRRLTIAEGGNVGIGTAVPTRPLHIYGSMRLDMNAATYSTQSATQAWTGGTWYQLVAPGALTNLAQGITTPTTYLISMTWNTTANNPYNLYCSFLYNCGWSNDGSGNQLSGATVPTSYHASNSAGDFQVSIRGNAASSSMTGFDFKVNATTTTGYWIVKAMIISYY